MGEEVELLARHHHPDEMPPYERLLGDAMRGRPDLLRARGRRQAAWKVVDPILDDVTPVHAI